MAIDFPSSPTTNQNFIADNGQLYIYDGASWNQGGGAFNPNPASVNLFKYRSIYTRGYVMGGYQNSSPWSNVNRTVHYTDTTVNLGNLMDRPGAYVDGSYSDYNAFVYATDTLWPGTGNYVTSINMTNETGRANNTKWNLKNSAGNYGDVGVILDANLINAWILSDQTNIDKHNLVSETMNTNGTGGSCGTPGDYVCAWFGQYYGWVKHNSSGNRNHKLLFATETWSAAGLTVGTDGWGKALPTKDGKAYVKNGGNIVTSIYTVDDTTGSNINTGLNMPEASGEENFQTGQIWGYSLGNYNGAQNNNTHKIVHATDTITTMGSDTQPKGNGGMSSAATASASATMIGGL